MTKPSLPQGTRDFGPDTVRKRNYIFETIRNVFELYGFQPLETPAMENIETLMGKYGEEGDKLIFKIVSNKADENAINAIEDPNTFMRESFEKIADLIGPGKMESKEVNGKVKYVVKNLEDKRLVKEKIREILKTSTTRALKYDLTIPFARYVAMNHNQLTFPFNR